MADPTTRGPELGPALTMADPTTRGPELGPALTRLYGSPPGSIAVEKLQGDASTRIYYRVTVEEALRAPSGADRPHSLIAMQLPTDSLRSDEATFCERPEELPFLDVQRLLRARGVPVPEVLQSDLERGILLLEDLGDETFARRLNRLDRAQWPAQYEQAVDLLVRLHRACERSEPRSIAYRRRFDGKLIRWELDHFRQWGLVELYGQLDGLQKAELERDLERLAEAVLEIPVGFVHRDFQSRNLMWAKRGPGEQLVVIDFQDALQGPVPYDLVALLCDSYLQLELDLQERMIERYLDGRGLRGAGAEAFGRAFWTVAVHRKLKDAGRFVFIDRVRGDPGFLEHYPQSLAYVGRALGQLGGFSGLFELLRCLIPGFPGQVPRPAAGGCSPLTTG